VRDAGAAAAELVRHKHRQLQRPASVQRQRIHGTTRLSTCLSLALGATSRVGAPAPDDPTRLQLSRLAAFSARRVVVSASTRPPRGGRESTSRRSDGRRQAPMPLRLCAFAASETRLSVPRGAGAAPAPLQRSRRTASGRHTPTPWTAWRRVRRRRSARRVARQRAAHSRHAATERHDGDQRAGVRQNMRRAGSRCSAAIMQRCRADGGTGRRRGAGRACIADIWSPLLSLPSFTPSRAQDVMSSLPSSRCSSINHLRPARSTVLS
jgi:hypothetical protein